MATSPTQLTLKMLRKQGYMVAIVEHWNPHVKRRVDLWGCIDIIAIRGTENMAVQCTSWTNVLSRVKKITDSEALPILRDANWTVKVFGWRKPKHRWEVKEVDIS